MLPANPYSRPSLQERSDELSSLSLSSQPSILADEKFVSLEAIKQSIRHAREKEVTLLTPVMLDAEDLARKHKPKTVAYSHGTRFSELPPLPALASKTGGMIIEMPLEGIREYLDRVITLDSLEDDESLVLHLDKFLGTARVKPLKLPPQERLELDFRGSVLCGLLEKEVSERVVKRLREPPAAPSESKSQKRLLESQLNLHSVRQHSHSASATTFKESWTNLRASKTQSTVRKRDAKRFEKEAEILERYMQGAKPRFIAKEFAVSAQFVSRTVQLLKQRGLELRATVAGEG